MEIAESVKKILQEMVVPELGKIREENKKILAVLEVTNKRLDDVNTQLADQSRRIDDTDKRLDDLRSELTERIDDTNKRLDDLRSELTQRIDEIRTELTSRMDSNHADLVHRLDANNERIDRFFLTAATKEEQARVNERLGHLEREVDDIRKRVAA
ncbi:MAG: hypothetical protein K9M96_06520 [Deltaproteobacteria bacterium]|nr:hypothetical protein [Deltaproteobacteria bacterium]